MIKKTVKQVKKEFLLEQIFKNSWKAAVIRNKSYKKNNIAKGKGQELKEYVKEYLEKLLENYKHAVSEKKHINNIKSLSDNTKKYRKGSSKGALNIGTSQKIINLFLKYYWCMGEIKVPPHCPIDRIILLKAGIKGENWTQINDIDKYEGIIEKLKNIAKPKNLSEWELAAYQA